MAKTICRHIDEMIMILAELIIAAVLMLQLPSTVEIITVCVGVLSMMIGGCCITRYYRTTPSYTRYAPELRRGVSLILAGFAVSTMRIWFRITANTPAATLGLTLLMIALFKTAIILDARCSDVPYLFFPTLSAFFTFALSFISFLIPAVSPGSHWIRLGTFMTLVLLVDACEIYASEAKKREPWSMQIRCWM